nr:hypothetical protein [Tanacetum cinerariifolium]
AAAIARRWPARRGFPASAAERHAVAAGWHRAVFAASDARAGVPVE